jgi:hypothetical protein
MFIRNSKKRRLTLFFILFKDTSDASEEKGASEEKENANIIW